MAIDPVGELLVGREALPLEARAPVLEEAPRVSLSLVAPERAEGLLEQGGRVEPLIGGPQPLQRLPARKTPVLLARQQGVRLPLKVTAFPAREPRLLALSDRIEHRVQVAQDGG